MIDGTTKLLKVPRICFFQSLSLSLSGKALLESIKFSTFHFAFKILKAFQKTNNSVSWHLNVKMFMQKNEEDTWQLSDMCNKHLFLLVLLFSIAILLKKNTTFNFSFYSVSSQLQNDVSLGFNQVKVKRMCFLLFLFCK